jgi:signal recognition particle GTPase
MMRNIAYGKMNKDAKPNLYIIAGPNGSGKTISYFGNIMRQDSWFCKKS